MPPKRHLALAAAVAVSALVAWTSVDPLDAGADTTLTVTTPLPAWAAPRAVLRIRGRTAPEVPVALFIGERRRSTTSGARGGFRFRVRAPREPGRYAVFVAAEGARVALGVLRVRPLLLAAVGDVTFGDGVLTAIRAHGARYPWHSVASVLRSADLAVANLEGAVSRRGAPWPGKLYTFRGPPRALRAAAYYAGVDVVSVANNHSLDYGRTAFLDTIRHARRFGVAPVGGGADLRRARRPALVTRGNVRVAFLGFSDVRPLGFDAGATTPGATPAFPEYIRADVRRARRRADVVVAYFHWGIERATRPNARQRSLARTALDAGAHVVLGAHPHVLQPIRHRGNRLVAWSLGNFVFAAHSPGTERTGILRIRLGARGVLSFGFRRARIHGVQPRLLR
ncbi:MAG TPA: CapA family protein [Gaiellaceae bacterium]|nr:CapA family protein [Gaiellaceae bacterium]